MTRVTKIVYSVENPFLLWPSFMAMPSEFVPTGGLGMKLAMNIDADSLYKYV